MIFDSMIPYLLKISLISDFRALWTCRHSFHLKATNNKTKINFLAILHSVENGPDDCCYEGKIGYFRRRGSLMAVKMFFF